MQKKGLPILRVALSGRKINSTILAYRLITVSYHQFNYLNEVYVMSNGYQPLTVNALFAQLLELKQAGKGDALVLLSQDDEWNWFRAIDKSQISIINDEDKGDIADLMHSDLLDTIGGLEDKEVIVLG